MSICRFCNQERKLIKAHIESEKFYLELGDPHMYSRSGAQHPKKLPIGVYDRSILCAGCDRRIGKWEQYAIELLLQQEGPPIQIVNGARCKILSDVDYARFRLFALSLLWRASVSTMPFYEHVVLGSSEEYVLGLLKDERTGHPQEFDLMLHELGSDLVPSITQPEQMQIGGSSHYRFCLGRFRLFIKVEQGPVAQPEMYMNPSGVLPVWIQPHYGKNEWKPSD